MPAAMAEPVRTARMPRPAGRLGVRLHHRAQRLDAGRQADRSKLADTSCQALPTAPTSVGGKAIDVVLTLFMALLSFRGITTPSLPAQGEQRRFFYFNIDRDNSIGAPPPGLTLFMST